MSAAARVTSIDALAAFREAFCKFGAEAREALSAAEMEIHRTFNWLSDQEKHWRKVVLKCQDQLTQAKADLFRRNLTKTISGRPPDCTQEEKAVARAKQRLQEAEDKVELCRRWVPRIQHAVVDYQGPARQLGGHLEVEFPKTTAMLDRQMDALEEYLQVAAPSSRPATGGTP